jgi:hypothetical protein
MVNSALRKTQTETVSETLIISFDRQSKCFYFSLYLALWYSLVCCVALPPFSKTFTHNIESNTTLFFHNFCVPDISSPLLGSVGVLSVWGGEGGSPTHQKYLGHRASTVYYIPFVDESMIIVN